MSRPDESNTRATLLGRLAQSGDPDEAAWGEFVEQYGRKIRQWCLRWQLQPADAEDVTQIVLLKLSGRMREFRYDPTRSFRAWLKTVTHHAWRDFADAQRRPGQGQGGDCVLEVLRTAEAREDLARRLEEEFDSELLTQAMTTVRAQVAPQNWEAFHLTAVEGVPAPEAAARLGMKVARVYSARSHVQQRLQDVCRRLEGDEAT